MDDEVATEAPRLSLEIEDAEKSILSDLGRRLRALQDQDSTGYAGNYRKKVLANAKEALEEAEKLTAVLKEESLAIDSLLKEVDMSLRGIEKQNNG